MTRILVVDDEPTVLEFLVDVLCDEGYELTVADNGVMALQMLGNTGVDLVITDTMMPELGGVELIRSLREHPELRDVPVVLMSAAARPGLDGLGTVNFLPKPFDLAALLDAVEEALRSVAGK